MARAWSRPGAAADGEEAAGWSRAEEQLVPASRWFWGAWLGITALMLAMGVMVSLFARA